MVHSGATEVSRAQRQPLTSAGFARWHECCIDCCKPLTEASSMSIFSNCEAAPNSGVMT